MGLRCSSFLLLVLLSLSHFPPQLTTKFGMRLEFSRQLGAKEEIWCWWTEKACDVQRVWWESGKCLPHTEEKRCFVAKCWTESSPLPQGEESCAPFYSFLFLVYSFSCLSHFIWKWTAEPNINFAWPEMNKNTFLLVFCLMNWLLLQEEPQSCLRVGTGGSWGNWRLGQGGYFWAAWLRVLEKITP